MHPTAVRTAGLRKSQPTATTPGVVLFVTCDTDLREVAARVLAREGYCVLAAAHAGHAVLASLQAERVDVAVIEMSMADVSGPALADRLRRQNPDLRVIFIGRSGTADGEDRLVRPFTREDLLARLALTLAR
jgi:DNA-binding response OmpR family regulator